MMIEPDDYMTIDEFMKAFNKKRRNVYKHMKKGKLRYITVFGKRLIPRKDHEEALYS